jgi:ribosomal protein L12E/L44/L45/RPP1/RPP2
MTRKKKTRSLKRIHSVKTGNTSKLKRAAAVDRQNSNLKAKNKTKSVYQKYLEENPEAAETQVQNTPAKKSQAQKGDKSAAKKPDTKSTEAKKTKKEPQEEQEVDLLSQLDNKNFNDLY